MARDVTDLEKLIKLARKLGLKNLKFDGVEFEFKSPAKKTNAMTPPSGGTLASLSEETMEMPKEDEMLFYSTEHFDKLKTERNKSGAQ